MRSSVTEGSKRQKQKTEKNAIKVLRHSECDISVTDKDREQNVSILQVVITNFPERLMNKLNNIITKPLITPILTRRSNFPPLYHFTCVTANIHFTTVSLPFHHFSLPLTRVMPSPVLLEGSLIPSLTAGTSHKFVRHTQNGRKEKKFNHACG